MVGSRIVSGFGSGRCVDRGNGGGVGGRVILRVFFWLYCGLSGGIVLVYGVYVR